MINGIVTEDGVRKTRRVTTGIAKPFELSPRDVLAESLAGTNAWVEAGATHGAARILLPDYAAGTLASADAEAVRAHLATGCSDCLGALYRMPVGMPRDVPPVVSGRAGSGGPTAALGGEQLPVPTGPASGAGPSWLVRAVGLAVTVALIALALSGWRR